MNKNTTLETLAIDQLSRGQFQPRRQFNAEALAELAQSIQSNGIVQPIVVRAIANQQYEIIAGERRWRAAQLAGFTEVPCIVTQYNDEQAAEVAAIENLQRSDLNPVEEAQAYQRLIDEFAYTHEEIANAVGKSRVKISNSLRLLKLSKAIQELLIAGRINEGHAKVLLSLPANLQSELAHITLSRNYSVRQLEREAKKALATKNPQSNQDNDLVILERELAEHIGCHVKLNYQENSGKLEIDFKNLDVLQGLFEKMGFKSNN